MTYIKKNDLILKIQELGERPPEGWTRVELMARYHELLEEKGVAKKKLEKTDLQHHISRLNAASRKKSNLVQFCQDLCLVVSSKATIEELQAAALNQIYTIAPVNGHDIVGFGPWASLSYCELHRKHPDFCAWAKVQAQQKGASSRLARLARWLSEQPQSEEETPSDSTSCHWWVADSGTDMCEGSLMDAIMKSQDATQKQKKVLDDSSSSWTFVSDERTA